MKKFVSSYSICQELSNFLTITACEITRLPNASLATLYNNMTFFTARQGTTLEKSILTSIERKHFLRHSVKAYCNLFISCEKCDPCNTFQLIVTHVCALFFRKTLQGTRRRDTRQREKVTSGRSTRIFVEQETLGTSQLKAYCNLFIVCEKLLLIHSSLWLTCFYFCRKISHWTCQLIHY